MTDKPYTRVETRRHDAPETWVPVGDIARRIVERAARIRRIAEREIAREGSNVVRFQPGKEPR